MDRGQYEEKLISLIMDYRKTLESAVRTMEVDVRQDKEAMKKAELIADVLHKIVDMMRCLENRMNRLEKSMMQMHSKMDDIVIATEEDEPIPPFSVMAALEDMILDKSKRKKRSGKVADDDIDDLLRVLKQKKEKAAHTFSIDDKEDDVLEKMHRTMEAMQDPDYETRVDGDTMIHSMVIDSPEKFEKMMKEVKRVAGSDGVDKLLDFLNQHKYFEKSLEDDDVEVGFTIAEVDADADEKSDSHDESDTSESEED